MDTEKMIRELRATANKHRDDKLYTFDTNITAVCTDVANRLEELLNESNNHGWVPVSERLPTMDEYRKNDARFIVSDGNRVYQDYFNIYDQCWLKSPNDLVAAWQPLPDKYKFPVDI